MGLTIHQAEKLSESMDVLKKGSRLVLAGSAGVGKTYMADHLIAAIRDKHKFARNKQTILCTAPTNKAVSVLKGKVTEYEELTFTTVHIALKMKQKINNKTGEISFKPAFGGTPPLKDVGLLIIDEASMLNKELLNYVEEFAEKNDTIVVFIGDDKQLNPVKEEDSPVFTAGYPTVELTHIVRQGAGNPIIDLSRNLSVVNTKEDARVGDSGYIFTKDLARIVSTLATVNGTDELKYLCWTNKEMTRINNLVRRALYGESPAKVEEGETLVFKGPYKKSYYTNQEFKVKEFNIKEKTFGYTDKDGRKTLKLKYYSINPFNDKEDNIMVIHEDSESKFENALTNIKFACFDKTSKVSWLDFFEFKQRFAEVTYNHAITVHKSQGSTYKQAIINLKNLNLNKNKVEKERLLYTAVTRASDLLVLYKP